ncbi:MAG: hypothetical protein BroJett018_36150 [Chloroflexota bacterium]|nr:DUF5060 domain-containing protein [Chloroflexota bacterium]GIK65821.1 MAG: hypothetical protein BroJett018_36150 [Chloroflexota bacterium]
MRKKLWLFLMGFLFVFLPINIPKWHLAVQAQDPSPENIALGKPAFSSTIENSGYLPEYAVDGLENTRWSTEYADEQWLAVDLAGVYAITQFTLTWEAAYGGEYELQVWDGEVWQTVFSESTGNGGEDDIILSEVVNARFVRMNGIKRATSWGYSLWEFEVYGTPAENPDPDLENTPDIFTATDTPIESTPIPTEEAPVVSDGASEVRAIQSVTPLVSEIGLYEKFELEIALDATFTNPYDPTDILVEAQFEAPSGREITIPAFYYRDFTEDTGQPIATNNFAWRVRFTPQEIGEYRYQVMASTVSSSIQSEAGTFVASESSLPGFIRVDSRNPRYFAFDDGSPYFPVGLDVAWSNGDTITDYTTWLDALQASGGNFIRLWMAPWNMTIEWTDTGLGNYDKRQFRAYELDRVIELAEERGIYIMLTLLNHGQFNTTVNPEWDLNPYNVENGGPCEAPECFATNPEAIRFWEQRLRYIVARWGYSPNIMAWEWWNEINWTPLSSEEILAPWIKRNTALLDEIDPYNHLVTHSGSPVALEGVWSPLDFAQDHFYDRDDFPRTFGNAIEEWSAAYPDKPFLVGEFGRNSGALIYDLQGVEMHLGIWGAPMTGAAGTGMSWWWDTYIHPNNLWNQLYTGISAFFKDEDLAAHQWSKPNADFAERTKARVLGLQAEDTAILWVINRDYSAQYLEKAYLKNLRNKVADPYAISFPEIEGAVLLVSDLPTGAYQVEIWDTIDGTVMQSEVIESADGVLTIPLPTFSSDLAIKVKPA